MDIVMPARMMRPWTARTRIACFLAAIMSFAAFARSIVVPPQPVSPYADTEISTNVAFSASSEHTLAVCLSFALDGCASNCVQVAFGRDADGDGVLGVDEAETLYGWRNGRHFAENAKDGVRIEEEGDGGSACLFAVNMKLWKDCGLSRFFVTNGVGTAILTNLSANAQTWLYQPDWNMMRVTRRGPDIPVEWFTFDSLSRYFYIKLR